MVIIRTKLVTMNQTMPNSQETVLEITFTEDLVSTREGILITPLSLLFKVEAIYPLRAPGSDIMMVNLANVIQTMPKSLKTCLVGQWKVLVGVASKHSNLDLIKSHSLNGYNSWPSGAIMGDIQDKRCYNESDHAQYSQETVLEITFTEDL